MTRQYGWLRTGTKGVHHPLPWLVLRLVAGEWRVESRHETEERAELRCASLRGGAVVAREGSRAAETLLGAS